jgi:Leucine-rich repeat (LRR) protein
MTFEFDPSTNTWELKSTPNQTVPESIGFITTPTSFSFGGATIEKGVTEIDGSSLGINGSGSTYRFISRQDVEALVNLCPDLTKLQLDHCYLETYEPLSRLTKLKYLDLKECGSKSGRGEQLTDIDWIASLTNLKELRLNGNAINYVTALEGLQKLTLLNLSDNQIDDASLESIAKLKNLEYLNLYINQIYDLEPLTALENVIYLNVHHTNLTGIDFLKKMKSVTWIYVGLDYDGNPLPYYNWYYVLRNSPNIQKIYINKKDTNIVDDVKQLMDEGYITEMKTFS